MSTKGPIFHTLAHMCNFGISKWNNLNLWVFDQLSIFHHIMTSLTKKNYTKIYVTYTWNILHIYVSYMYSLCRYMLAICICYIYVELGPTYMWHICKYRGSIWDWWKEKKTSKPTVSLWNWPIKLNWSSLNREMDAYLWEDRILFDFVHFILIQASLSYNHIYMFCITLLLYWVSIYLHYFID